MNLGKKILVFSVALAMVVGMMGPTVASAETVDELQAQITALQTQLNSLLTQLSGLEGTTVPAAGIPAVCIGVTFSQNLSQGATGSDVKCLQALLNQDGDVQVAISGAGSPGNETSYFGSLTKAAVIKFQEKYASEILASWGLSAGTGFVGSTTRAKLNSILTAPAPEPEPAYNNEADCVAAGMYWYGSACHSTAQSMPTGDLSIELADNTPAAGSLYIDTVNGVASANNVVARVKLTAGPSAVTVTGLTITKYGTAANGAVDIARVKVYEGATQLSTRVLVTDKGTFVFAPSLSLTAGASRTLDLVVDLTAPAAGTPGSLSRTLALGVAAATDVTASVAAVGNFPLVGNYFTIVQGSFGAVTVAGGIAPPATTPRIGENDRILANYIFSAGAAEDIIIESVTVTEGGTAADGDVTDVQLKTGSEALGTAASFGNRRAVMTLNRQMSRGTSLMVQLTGDITSGATRTVWPRLVGPDAVVAKGVTSGVYFTGPAAGAAVGPAAATAAITGGAMTVTSNVNSPTDNLVSAPVAQTIGIFDVRGTGENVVVQTVTLNFTHSAPLSAAYNAALYDESGGLLSNVVAIPAAGVAGQAFNTSITIPAGQTKKVYVKAFTNVLAVGDAAQTITVGVVLNGFAGVGELSGTASTAPAAAFNLPAITYRHTGTLTVALNTIEGVSPLNQSALIPSAENYWTAVTFIATREDIRLTQVQFNDEIAETTAAFVTCSLYDRATDGTLVQLDNQPWNYVVGAGNSNVNFNNIDLGTGIDIPMGAANAKVLVVKCSVSGAATATNAPELDIAAAGNLTATGATSGIAIPVGNVVGTNFGTTLRAKHTLRAAILEVQPNASAPSGNISRSSTATVGIWDLTARGGAIVFDNNNVGGEAEGNPPLMVFTSFTGGIDATPSVTFRLVDATTGTVYAASNGAAVNATATTVTFTDGDFATGAAQLIVAQDSTVSVKLQENITSTVLYPQYTSLQFGFANAAAIDTRADEAVAAVNDAGGLISYPATGLEARCPEVRIQ